MSADWKPAGPFAWLPKPGLALIDRKAPKAAQASLKLLYLALCRIASDEGLDTFEKPMAYVATLASLNRRTVERRLPEAEALGLVRVERTKFRSAHRYAVATLSRNDTTLSPNVATPSPNCVATQSRTYKRTTERREEESARTKLTTAQRIGLENQQKTLKEKIQTLRDNMEYEFERTPARKSELARFKARLAEVEEKLTFGEVL